MMGGVRTNTWGETNVRNLYAAGEVACTGVHGANRLASNSLLETIVFAKRAVEKTLMGRAPEPEPAAVTIPLPEVDAPNSEPPALDKSALQSLMWQEVGIIRSGESLTRARATLASWERRLPPMSDRSSWELGNMVLTSRLVAEAALLREESRGAHYRTDFPEPRESWLRHIVFKRDA
jgi:L-aspartate oxidase